ncbi:hypothetical protein NQ015_00030 [Corynebacterium sp. 153RC1]|uniref:hypothetical protein n=1 Tax=unclassified Corynebacterium TaxID=2624378 RepID=UPI00211BACD5|nr:MULTISPECIES: hypothetical protein [unclassified Corynebacterium]MCQ9371600.1 hypothetical protein [Corynebacterium sp. 35RC1]MCQ9351710.1 hypothetical protein [Corynebacterium sp. 209RC1]MCQ9354079.1 hypothetical protein [Corynebacterium sp. 1222RC1]MCQ9355992.1 hypothetical protein [Corynebacterium sp. 122RC1]MCQ9358236.1 hypothetical protein [Corynebacterium sp. 142RC1]
MQTPLRPRTLPPRTIEQAQGFIGFSVPTLLPGGGSLFGEELEPVWAALNQQSAVVHIHPTGQGLWAARVLGLELQA